MKTAIYLTLKYWKKHKKNALALLFSGILTVAVIVFTLLLVREGFNSMLQYNLGLHSKAELIIGNSDDEVLAYIAGDNTDYVKGTIYVTGETTAGLDRIPYGFVEDKNDIVHIPMESGRMPKTADEAAIEEVALEKMRWLGKVGDTIEIDGKRYTVTGIISNIYGERYYAPFSYNYIYDSQHGGDRTPNKYVLPLIFFGDTDKEPLYRIDHIYGLYDSSVYGMDYSAAYGIMYDDMMDGKDEIYNRQREVYIYQAQNFEPGEEPYWFNNFRGGDFLQLDEVARYEYMRKMFDGNETGFFLRIFALGAVIAILSVFSVLRNIFIERRSRTEILKRIGMSNKRINLMYAVECVFMTVLQTVIGLLAGCGLYGAVFAFRVSVLGMDTAYGGYFTAHSGFTANAYVSAFSPDPFLVSVIASVAIMALAYLITILTTKIKPKALQKNKKPNPLSRCMGKIFRQRAVSIIQTVALVLICFSVTFTYMYYTDTGKSEEEGFDSFGGGFAWDDWYPGTANYTVDFFDMEVYGIESYYTADEMPFFSGIESYGNWENALYIAPVGYSLGIDDELVEELPDYVMVTGFIDNPFIICEEPNNLYKNKIEFFEQAEKDLITEYSADEYKNFFDEGQTGSKYLYQAKTKLTRASTILSLEQYVRQGEINIDKLNSGEEVIAVVSAGKSPFEAGEMLNLGFISDESGIGYGISDIGYAEVRVGAVMQIPPSVDMMLGRAVKYDFFNNDGTEPPYNLLTTATGAQAMGMPCSGYTTIYCMGEMDGGLIPADAGMNVTHLSDLKRANFLANASRMGGSLLIMAVMLLLGFAAYFNGIGMKIRLKAYDISVLRAVGTSLKKIKLRLLLASVKIPLTASAISYALLTVYRTISDYVSNIPDFSTLHGHSGELYEFEKIPWKTAAEILFWYNRWWAVDPLLPTLVIFAAISAVSLLLTHRAFRKFKSNIAENLSEGRTRQ